MALASTNYFASFDIADGSQDRDISPVLQAAIFYDLHLLGALNVDFANPVHDTVHYWNEMALNSDTFTMSGSQTSSATSVTVTTGHGARVHAGDLIGNRAINSTEVAQVTNVSTDTLTVVRGYDSTTAAVWADGDTFWIVRAEQEGSDIGTDKSVAPTVRSNSTQIFSTYDLLITGTQLARRMATNELQDYLAYQLADRAKEMKINLTRGSLYSEKPSTGAGSDSVYRSFGGIRYWGRTYGNVNSSSGAMSISVLDTDNKTSVDQGVFPDTLVIGTDLVGSIAGIDSANRRFRESDTQAGYTVQEILLKQGNMVRVVVDSRVNTGDYFLFDSGRIKLMPMTNRGMFVIAATDFADAKKRRILGEWTMEVRNPQTLCIGRNKT